MIAAEGKQRRAGLEGRQHEAGTPGRLRQALGGVLEALLFPIVLSVAAATLPYRRLAWRRSLGRASAEPPKRRTEAEEYAERLQGLTGEGRTLAYLLQSSIAQLDQLAHPRDRKQPLRQARSMPAAGLRVVRARRYHPGPVTSRRGIPLGLGVSLLTPLILLAAAFAGVGIYNSYIKEMLPPEEMAVAQLSRGARIYDRNGQLLYEFVDEEKGTRIPVSLEEVSDTFLAATIATEDESFFTNPGVNLRGLTRAAWENFGPYLEDDKEHAFEGSGGSSITQQLVKNVYIPLEERGERSVDRKLREATYAVELTQRYDKRQILEWYVNQISYGGVFNGVEAASQGYFGKAAKDLTLAEAALLAGIPQSPAAYDPINRPEAALARREAILDLIEKQGRIQIGEDRFYEPAPQHVEEARATPLQVQLKTYPIDAPHFVLNHVAPELEAMYGRDALYHNGLAVTTSIDIGFQRRAQETLERWIREFENISNSRNGALVVIDNHTGEIVSLIGSRDYFRDDIQGNVDNLTALNSPGSTFKPFVYLTSFLKLGWNPNTIIEDAPVSFRESDGTVFSPTNPSRGSYLGPIPIRTALGNSLNVPAFRTALRLGVPPIVETAKRLGFTTLHGLYGPSIATGGVDLSAMDLTYGYSVLANNGAMVGHPASRPHAEGERELDPIAIVEVKDSQGNVVYNVNDHRAYRQVVPAEQAYLINTILSDPSNQCVTFGCGGVSIPGRVAGVKTGTSEPFDPRGPNAGKIGETWAFGYTPDFSVGVWAGNSDNMPVVNIFSTSISYRVMRDTLQSAYDGRPSGPFARPGGIEERRVCIEGGACRVEFYVRGAAPPPPPAPPAAPPPRIAAPAPGGPRIGATSMQPPANTP